MKNCYKVINVENLKFNISYIKNKLKKTTKLCAVVKSDAYGHGIKNICKNIEDTVDFFAVSTNKEAISVKKLCPNRDCLVLTPLDTDSLNEAIRNQVTFCIQDIDTLKLLNARAKNLNLQAKFHLSINTGMNRYGIINENLKIFMDMLKTCDNTILCGVFSHLGSGDDILCYRTDRQAKNFLQAMKYLPSNIIRHISNTQNILTHPQYQFDMVRTGIGLYGYGEKNLRPVMSIMAKLISIQNVKKGEYIGYGLQNIANLDMRIGVVAIGYANGLPRSWAKNGYVMYRNKKAKIVARICMEATIIDISNLPIQLGEYVSILGSSPELNAEVIANNIGTIPYEILTNFKNIPIKK